MKNFIPVQVSRQIPQLRAMLPMTICFVILKANLLGNVLLRKELEKINLDPVSELNALDIWQDAQAMSDTIAVEGLTACM